MNDSPSLWSGTMTFALQDGQGCAVPANFASNPVIFAQLGHANLTYFPAVVVAAAGAGADGGKGGGDDDGGGGGDPASTTGADAVGAGGETAAGADFCGATASNF